MTHTVQETGKWQHTVSIEVTPEVVEARLEDVARQLQRRVAMPGFRKGKVPMDRVRSDFASHIEQEFLERFIPQVTSEALAEAKLDAVVPPYIENLKFSPGQPLRFDAIVDVAPQAECKEYKGLPAVRRARTVDEAAIDAVVNDLLEDSAVFIDVAKAAESGDVVLLDSQRLDANGRRLANTRAKGTRIQLGAPELLPDLEAGLLGCMEGQERTIAVTYPDDYRQAELAGKAIRYVVKIRKIQQKKRRELDDNFARELFKLDSLTELRDRVRQNLEAEDGARVRRELEGALTEELLNRNPVELSERLVSYMLDQVIREQTKGREVGAEMKKTFEEHYRPGVERSLKREVLLAAVARQESLASSDEEVAEDIDRMAAADPKQASRVRARYQTAERRNNLRGMLIERKAMDLVIGSATLNDMPFQAEAETAGAR